MGIEANESAETKALEEVETTAASEGTASGGGKSRKALSRNAKACIAIGCVAVAAAVGVAAFALTHQAATLPAGEPVATAEDAAAAEEGGPQDVAVGYEGYEARDGDTPVIAHVTGATAAGGEVDFYHAVSGAEGEVRLDPGDYRVEYLPVLAEDGSMVSARDGAAVTADVDGEAVSAKAEASSKGADQVTADDVKGLLDKVEQAVAKGDDTLKGDAGKDVASKVAEAAKATGKVDAAEAEEAEKKAEEASESSPAATPGGSPQPSASQPSGGGSAGGSTASAPASQPSQSAHVHDWQPVTEQRWVSNIVTVVDQEAYTSSEITGSVIVCNCGLRFNSFSEWEAHVDSYF